MSGMDRGVKMKHSEDGGTSSPKAASETPEEKQAPRFSELDREHGDEAEQAKRIAEQKPERE